MTEYHDPVELSVPDRLIQIEQALGEIATVLDFIMGTVTAQVTTQSPLDPLGHHPQTRRLTLKELYVLAHTTPRTARDN